MTPAAIVSKESRESLSVSDSASKSPGREIVVGDRPIRGCVVVADPERR